MKLIERNDAYIKESTLQRAGPATSPQQGQQDIIIYLLFNELRGDLTYYLLYAYRLIVYGSGDPVPASLPPAHAPHRIKRKGKGIIDIGGVCHGTVVEHYIYMILPSMCCLRFSQNLRSKKSMILSESNRNQGCFNGEKAYG